MAIYYNDFEPYAAQWLRNLIAAGHLPAGDVDERSITEVTTDDLKGYTQCHFFAGIGGWPLALRWAGWPDDRPVWTGSCPCQPLSVAGKRKGDADERHLWPAFQRLIAESRPSVVFGEQVASKDGREWLSAVRLDLEQLDYAVGAADLPAASVGAPHARQRLWWVANAESERQVGWENGRRENAGTWHDAAPRSSQESALDDSGGTGRTQDITSEQTGLRSASRPDWADIEWLECVDGRARPTQSGLYPLAHGIPNRVGRLRAYGNAIVPQVAAVFIDAAMAVIDGAIEMEGQE